MKMNSSGRAALPILVGQSCRSAPFSPSASAARLTESGCDNLKARTSLRSFWRKFGRRGSAALPLLAAIVLFFAVGAMAETTNTLSDAEIQGCQLAQKILMQKPAEDSEFNGTLEIHSAQGKEKFLLSTKAVLFNDTWETIYFATPYGVQRLTVIHSTNQPNKYIFQYTIAPPISALSGGNISVAEATTNSFAGSDFSLTDLGLEFFHWPAQKILKKEVKRSRGCSVLESTNPNPTTNGYSRVVSWIDEESGGIVQAEAYDFNGKLLKEFAPKSFKKVNGQWELQEMEIRNVQTGSRTRLEFDLKK
jgi:hypothetical protein